MKLTSFDVETKGTGATFALEPFRARTGEAWVTMCAMATDAGETVEIKPDADYLRAWLVGCASSGTTVCGWNVPFDMAWLIAMGLKDEVFACRWLDGMILWRHLTASPLWTKLAPPSYGLKACVATHMPEHTGYDEGVDFDADQFSDPIKFLELIAYNKLDARFTLQLVKKFWGELNEKQKATALIEAAALPLVAEAYVEGIACGRGAAEILSKKLLDDMNLAFVKLKLNSSEDISPDILASPAKLRKLLYQDWGLTAPKQTPKGSDSTDRDALDQLADVDPRAKLLNDYREAKNNRTKFAEGTVLSLDYNGDGRTRPNARVYGTYTGRMTYSSKVGRGKEEQPSGVPLHQWKRRADFRELIEAPEGYSILEVDFAGQEYRWMAVFSGDPTMLGLCNEGEDAHSYMGAQIARLPYLELKRGVRLGDEVCKKQRQLGKVGNLSAQYRTGHNTLQTVARVQHQVKLTLPESKAIISTYRTTYPRVPVYWSDQIRKARIDGYVETISGRQVHVGTGDSWFGEKETKRENVDGIDIVYMDPFDNTWGCESTAINFPIQGSGADQKYLALAVARDYINSIDGRFYYELHDGLYFIVPDRHLDAAAAAVRRLLSDLPYAKAWGVTPPVSFPVDAKIGKTWGQLKEFVG